MKKQSNGKSSAKFYDFLKFLSYAALILSVLSLVAVILYVLISGVTKLNLDLLFGEYGKYPSILPAFVGTLRLIFIAISVSVPVGVFSAVFLTEYTKTSGKTVAAIRIATETLSGIPSIVYGLFGYLFFTYKWGYTLLGGGLTLAIMVLPTIVRQTEESLLQVPLSFREGAYALGSSKVRTIFKVVLPSASGGIVSSVILAVGRVISESAVLILTIGMVVNKVPETLMSPGTSLALDVYYFGSHGYPDEAAATAVVLLFLVAAINLIATGLGKLINRKLGETK